jgi:hypothetical protein
LGLHETTWRQGCGPAYHPFLFASACVLSHVAQRVTQKQFDYIVALEDTPAP